MSSHISFGILTVGDSCYANYNRNSNELLGLILKEFPSAEISKTKIVPDNWQEIVSTLLEWCDLKLNVIFTTGGTGFSSRDVTPDATLAVVQKQTPDLSLAMMTNTLKITPIEKLPRLVCGIRDSTLIVNLPGNPKGASECFGIVKEALLQVVALLIDQKGSVVSTLEAMKSDSGASVVPVDVPAGATSPSKVKLQVALRDRESPYPIIDVEVAFGIIKAICIEEEKTTEMVPFESSLNRILAVNIYASEPIPPFETSMIDGYAVKSSEGAGTRFVKKVAAAGDEPIKDVLQPGEVIRISSGAPIPAGANAVVQVEDTSVVEYSVDGDEEVKVEIKRTPQCNKDIREIGRDVPMNSLVLNEGKRIKSFHLGVLAMLGKTKVLVYKRPSVGIMSTGNEICEPGEELTSGKIRDANRYTLMNLLKNCHYEANDCGIVKDNPDAMKNALEQSFTRNDVLITSGGVSMGEFDMLKQVLVKDFQAKIHFARVNMKPGNFTTFLTLIYNGKRKMVFGLPGNPASCGVTGLLFVIPALRLLEKTKNFNFPLFDIPTKNLKDKSFNNEDNLREYRRVKINSDLSVTSTGDQTSSRLNNFVDANGLLILESKKYYSKSGMYCYQSTVNYPEASCKAILFDETY